MSNFLPVYVQTSTRVLGYLNAQLYDAPTAAGYIGAFIATLDPAAVSLSGVPPANLAQVNGVAEAFSFSYIDAQAEGACGILPGANFLTAAVAGNGLSGDVPYFRLRAAFNNLLPRRVPNGRYLFAVIDHNAAHHFSIPFIEYAFTLANSAGLGRQRVIVILDQHSDIGSAQAPGPPTMARCENWGGLALKTVGAAPAPATIVADRYLHTGWAAQTLQRPVNVTQQYVETNQTAGGYIMGRIIPPGAPQDLFHAVLAGLAGQPLNGTDVYITWDRDSVQGSMTPWGDGMYPSAPLVQAISNLATSLTQAGARLVGVDVVGLPAQGGYSQGFPNLTAAAALANANTDIVALLTAVRPLAP